MRGVRGRQVLLVQMPFGLVHRPSIALSLLKACLERAGYECDVRYLNNDFAALIGLPVYDAIADQLPQQLLIGELIFAPIAFPGALHPGRVHELCERIPPHVRTLLPWLTECARIFLARAFASIDWSSYQLVGFTSMFQQTVPCLALARSFKSLPDSPAVILGGANCEGEMGETLHRCFPWIDFVCQGEGERLIVELTRAQLDGESDFGRIGGLIWRDGGRSVVNGTRGTSVPLDDHPVPRYHDWLDQIRRPDLPLTADYLMLPIETARGCWFGEKSHCTFCGLNGQTLAFRSKSADRVVEEFRGLASYGIPSIYSVDNILDFRYFKSVLPRVAELGLGLRVFYEVKSNLTREQVELLKAAGIAMIQPGIETLSSSILRLMKKGVTAFQNVRLLKWSAELGVAVLWHLLFGFPGEDPDEYRWMADLVPALTHLTPPRYGCVLVFLERFSPMYMRPEEHGVARVRPARAYAAVFPLPEEDLAGLAYYFDGDFAVPQDPYGYIGQLRDAVDDWRHLAGTVKFHFLDDGREIRLLDTRPIAARRTAALRGVEREVFLACESGASRKALGEISTVDSATLDRLLREMVACRWIVELDGRFLGLALRTGGPAPLAAANGAVAGNRAVRDPAPSIPPIPVIDDPSRSFQTASATSSASRPIVVS